MHSHIVRLSRCLAIAALCLIAPQFAMISCGEAQRSESVHLTNEGRIPSLDGTTEWLNSPPLSASALRGKVVLFDFWTYSCINSLRTLPYVRAWSEKYKDAGLIVIGIHAPEFAFEKNLDNVRWALKDMNVDFPIAVDNDHKVWQAFNNEYWPALYFVDAQGKIRHHEFGEGHYEESELVIQELLTQAGSSNIRHDFIAISPRGDEVGADWSDLQSPESYVGYERAQNFASPGGFHENKGRIYSYPQKLERNTWALSGDWTVGKESAVLNKPSGTIAYRFHARDLHLVMGPSTAGSSLRFRVLIDGEPPGESHGVDIDEHGNGTVTRQRLYQLVRQSKPIADHIVEIEFLDPGIEAFDFTFG